MRRVALFSQFVLAAVNSQPFLMKVSSAWQVTVPALSLLFSLVMSIAQPGYNPVKETISQLVHYPYGWLQTTDFVLIGAWLIILATRFFFDFSRKVNTRIGALMVLIMGLGFFLIAIFPAGKTGLAETIVGKVHELTARSICILFTAGGSLLALEFHNNPTWKPMTGFTIIATVVNFILVIICAWITAVDAPFLGLFERLLFANALLWTQVIAIYMVMPINTPGD